jgi:adenylate kinase family enzyme
VKIAILGYSGSGKSTLAKYLGHRYGIPVLYLDRVQFLPGWQVRDRGEAVSIVEEFMKQPSWVIDGNYSNFLQEKRLEQADFIVFMNFSRLSCFFRACRRYLQNRNISRESMADGCLEKMDWAFVRWILYEGRTKRKRSRYRGIVERYREKTVILKNQKQLDRFMEKPFFSEPPPAENFS